MGASGDDMTLRASNPGSVRNRFAGLSTTARPAPTAAAAPAAAQLATPSTAVTSSQAVPAAFHGGGGFHGGGFHGGDGGFNGNHYGWGWHPWGLEPVGLGPVGINDDVGSGITRYRFRHCFWRSPERRAEWAHRRGCLLAGRRIFGLAAAQMDVSTDDNGWAEDNS
jgi:hypothetical protein